MASQARVPAEIENINELWDLLEQKDEDLRHAAELGKMLLDEKEADAEAHEAEKDALWRRIEEMTTRVAELEQESTEAHLLLHQARVANYENGYGMTSVSSGGHSIRSGLTGGTVERAEETTLRAKNEVLERQLAIMKEQLEETKLELNASRKAHLYKKASRQTRDRSRWSLSSSTSPPRDTNRRREHSSGSVSCDDGDDTSVFPAPPSIHQRTSTPPEDPGISMRVSPLDRPATTAVSSSQASLRGDGARTSEASKKVADEATKSTGTAKEQEASRLLEQNASLVMELESKDELIEALRQQLKQQQQSKVQQLGIRGQLMSPRQHALPELSECDSDDCGDENEDPGDETRERSFMDDLLEETRKSPGGVTMGASNDEDNIKGKSHPASQRSFGGLLVENVPLNFLVARVNEEPETVSKTDGKKSKIQNAAKADRENSPRGGKKRSSLSPSRRRSLDQAKGASPAAEPGHNEGDVTGVVGRSATIAAPLSATVTAIAGALETWPQSPRGVPLSWSSAMRALAMIAPVVQQEPRLLEESEPESAQSMASEVTVSKKSMTEDVRAVNKEASEVVNTQALVSPEIVEPETAMKERGVHDENALVSPGSPRSILALGEHEVENAHVSVKEDKKFFSCVKEEVPISPESLKPETLVTELEMNNEAPAMDDEFDPLEKAPSPENVQAEVLMKGRIDSVQASERKIDISEKQVPISPESLKHETATKEQGMRDGQASVVEVDKSDYAVKIPTSPEPVQIEMSMEEVLAVKDNASCNKHVPTSPDSLEPIQPEVPTEEVLAIKDDTFSNERPPTSPESLKPEVMTKKLEIKDVQASKTEDNTSNPDTEQLSPSPEPVQTEVPMKEEEMLALKDDTYSSGQVPSSPESVKPATMATEQEVEDAQASVVEDKPAVSGEPKPPSPEPMEAEVSMEEEEMLGPKDGTSSNELVPSSPDSVTIMATEQEVEDAQASVVEDNKPDFSGDPSPGPLETDVSTEEEEMLGPKDDTSSTGPVPSSLESVKHATMATKQETEDFQADDESNTAGKQIPPSQKLVLNAAELLAMKDNSSVQQAPTPPESLMPGTMTQQEVEDPEASEVEDIKATSVEEQDPPSPEPVQTEITMKVALAMKGDLSSNEQAPTSLDFVKPETTGRAQEMGDGQDSVVKDQSNSAKEQLPPTPEPRQKEVQPMTQQIEDVQLPAVEDSNEQVLAILKPLNAEVLVEKEVKNYQVTAVDGEINSTVASTKAVKPEAVMTSNQEMKQVKPLVVEDGKSNIREGDVVMPPKPLKSEVLTKKVGGSQASMAKEINGKSAQTLGSNTEPSYLAQNRAERKSRQAMAKLGLRTVAGVFRVTMKTSNGHIFVVKEPDVFKHPQQDTYVIFGTAGTDTNGSEVHLPASKADREVPKVTQAPASAKPPSFAGQEAAKVMSASIDVDPADVMSVMSLTGRGSECAIKALCEEGGDVVNAVMRLTET